MISAFVHDRIIRHDMLIAGVFLVMVINDPAKGTKKKALPISEVVFLKLMPLRRKDTSVKSADASPVFDDP